MKFEQERKKKGKWWAACPCHVSTVVNQISQDVLNKHEDILVFDEKHFWSLIKSDWELSKVQNSQLFKKV